MQLAIPVAIAAMKERGRPDRVETQRNKGNTDTPPYIEERPLGSSTWRHTNRVRLKHHCPPCGNGRRWNFEGKAGA